METKMQKAIVVGLIVLLIARLISEILVITSANRVRSMGLRSCGRHCCPLNRPVLLEAVAGLIAGAASYYALSIVSGLKRRVLAT